MLATLTESRLGTEQLLPMMDGLDFRVPPEQEAAEPPEARGLARDGVRLMVSHRHDDRIVHTSFRGLPCFLASGDVLVINTSATMNAALPAEGEDGQPLELHLSTRLPADLWVVELREPAEVATRPFSGGREGERLRLPAGATARLLTPHDGRLRQVEAPGARLWIAALSLPDPLDIYLQRHGYPIRYGYVRQPWSPAYYQTVYATEVGSAEMPSAGRAFTPELITALVANGVQFAPLLLHTGVASAEEHELPYEEFYRVPEATARLVNGARAAGRRVIAVGTTAVRALETVADERGQAHPGEGWTALVINARRALRVVDGLLTGLHEPQATHLAMLEALVGRSRLERAYQAALGGGYLWHEFGDLHLILP